MATQFCQKYKSHPGRTCDYDDQGECAETAEVQDSAEDKCVTRSSRTTKNRVDPIINAIFLQR